MSKKENKKKEYYSYCGKLLKRVEPKGGEENVTTILSAEIDVSIYDMIVMNGFCEFQIQFTSSYQNAMDVHRRYAEFMAKHRLIPFYYIQKISDGSTCIPHGNLHGKMPIYATEAIVQNVKRDSWKKRCPASMMFMSKNACRLLMENKYALYGTYDEVGELTTNPNAKFPDVDDASEVFKWVTHYPYESQMVNKDLPRDLRWARFGELYAFSVMHPDVEIKAIAVYGMGEYTTTACTIKNGRAQLMIHTKNFTDHQEGYIPSAIMMKKEAIMSYSNMLCFVQTPIAIQKSDNK